MENKVTLNTLFPDGIPEALNHPSKGGKLQEPTVERVIMSCCGLLIWKRVDKHGNCTQSFGWTVNADSMVCIGCYYNKQLKQKRGEIDNVPKS